MKVAFARVKANPDFGPGGAWQFYVDDYAKTLLLEKQINLH